ncbi:MAG: prenyltransferase [Nitrososphaerota archaeon]|nr:prenyltransferase [Nitrososphaerota archaeon]
MASAGRRLKRWAVAFGGFYGPGKRGDLDGVSAWLYSARSAILVISAQSAIIAGILAYTYGTFDAAYFLLVLSGFVILHAASNLTNDYYGYYRGKDTPDSPRMRYTLHPLAGGVTSKKGLQVAICALLLSALGIAAFFFSVRGPVILLFFLAGSGMLLLYDASPVTLKSIGLGEVAAFLVWGPIMVGGGYFALTGVLSPRPFLASLPYGLGVMSILVGKHMDQLDFDRSVGQRTLPVILERRAARAVNSAVIAAMYAAVLALAALGYVGLPSLVVFANAPRAWSALTTLSRERPASPPVGYTGWPLWYHRYSLRHNRSFGWLYIAGLLTYAALHAL